VSSALQTECEEGLNGYIDTVAQLVASTSTLTGEGSAPRLGMGRGVTDDRDGDGDRDRDHVLNPTTENEAPSSRDLILGNRGRRSSGYDSAQGGDEGLGRGAVSVMLVFEALMALLFPGKKFDPPPSESALLTAATLEHESSGAKGGDGTAQIQPPVRVLRSWVVISRLLSLPAPRLAREMRRCVQMTLRGDDG